MSSTGPLSLSSMLSQVMTRVTKEGDLIVVASTNSSKTLVMKIKLNSVANNAQWVMYEFGPRLRNINMLFEAVWRLRKLSIEKFLTIVKNP